MRWLIWVTMIAALCTPSPAQGPETRSILDTAHSAPPEFAADVLITLVDAGLISDRQKKIELLSEAYNLALGAPEQVALDRSGAGPVNAAVHDLFGLGLDRVSLQARAVKTLLALDVRRAVDLYQEIDLPLERRFSCEEPVWYRLTSYYSVLPQVLKAVPEPLKRDEILSTMVARLRSAAQVQPIADVLIGLINDKVANLDHILYRFSDRLTKLDADSRVFTSSFPLAVMSLKRMSQQVNPALRQDLIEHTRQWVMQATSHGVCLQRPVKQMDMDGTIAVVDPVHPVDRFNSQLAALLESNPKIDLNNLDAPLPSAIFEPDRYSADFIRFDQRRRELAASEAELKDAAVWRGEVEKYLAQVLEKKDPKPDASDPTPFFLEKAELLMQLLAMKKLPLPAKPLVGRGYDEFVSRNSAAGFASRDQVALDFVNHLEGPLGVAAYRKRRSLWFAPVWRLLRSQENTPAIDEMLAQSSNPILMLYGQLAKLEATVGRTHF